VKVRGGKDRVVKAESIDRHFAVILLSREEIELLKCRRVQANRIKKICFELPRKQTSARARLSIPDCAGEIPLSEASGFE
jgi:hypothetical protein